MILYFEHYGLQPEKLINFSDIYAQLLHDFYEFQAINQINYDLVATADIEAVKAGGSSERYRVI